MFTSAQIREIASKIGVWGRRDSDFSRVLASGADVMAAVSDGVNVLDRADAIRAEAPSLPDTELEYVLDIGQHDRDVPVNFYQNGDDDTYLMLKQGSIVQQVLYALGYASRYRTFLASEEIAVNPVMELRYLLTLHTLFDDDVTLMGPTSVLMDGEFVGNLDKNAGMIIPVEPGKHSFEIAASVSKPYDRVKYVDCCVLGDSKIDLVF